MQSQFMVRSVVQIARQDLDWHWQTYTPCRPVIRHELKWGIVPSPIHKGTPSLLWSGSHISLEITTTDASAILQS